MGDDVKICLFPDLSIAESSEYALLSNRLDTALDRNSHTYYKDAAALLQNQKVTPVVGWRAAVKQL